MQSFSHPDVFFCPLYNAPGISDPFLKLSLGGSDSATGRANEDPYANEGSDSELAVPFPAWPPSDSGSHTSSSASTSPTSSRSSSRRTSPSSSSSASSSSSPSSPTGSASDQERKLHKYKRMSAKAGKSLLDFATEIEGRRLVHDKRKQVRPGSSPARALRGLGYDI
ncbi:hypothetical protein C8Q80DRAFT_1272862 [Daedaleopsis nitida]|nr:hypothetical protein C8Q80DRAFT_1272862 [Daedaleopsis nitida]